MTSRQALLLIYATAASANGASFYAFGSWLNLLFLIFSGIMCVDLIFHSEEA